MWKKLTSALLTVGLSLASQFANAQTAQPPYWCGATTVQERYFAEHPGAREAQQALYRRLEAMPAPMQQRGTTATPDVTIPVVVHVIHAGGAENISDAQINSAIAQLNIDYQKRNADTATITPLFQPIAASIGFQFRLARLDPNGNCTTGITRHYAPSLVNDNLTGAVQAVSSWDPNRYLNVWVVGTIGTPLAGGGVIGGYSFLPGTIPPPFDGFVVRNDFFGDIGTSTPAHAAQRAATHEIGHYFGLEHTWGTNPSLGTGDCTGTDYVADTPPTDGTFTCNTAYAPCGPIANVQNYMDYSSCKCMFTLGQKALIRNVLSVIRTQLTTPATLLATGTNDGYVPPAGGCAPVAQFVPSTTQVCEGSAVTFTDLSYNVAAGTSLTYSWSFPGGTPATSTSAIPTVTYSTPGFYNVTQAVSNGTGNNSTTSTNLIRVQGATGGETAPLFESFETSTFPANYPEPSLRNYTSFGTSTSGTISTSPFSRWRRVASVPAADGSASLMVNNSSFAPGYIATLITPNINLNGISQAVLSFKRAYALLSATPTEVLRICFSTDCGTTWSAPLLYDAFALTTQGSTPQPNGYIPASAADWQLLSLPLPAVYQGSRRFQVRFEMVNGSTAGNVFFMDALRISTLLASSSATLAQRGISLYPNPLTNETALHLTLPTATQVQVHLTDMLGREVLTLPAKTYPAGPLSLALASAGHQLQPGLYVVHISLGGESYSSKLTVE